MNKFKKTVPVDEDGVPVGQMISGEERKAIREAAIRAMEDAK